MKPAQFSFTPPNYGWIELRFSGSDQDCVIFCSETDDPFAGLFEWLELIATGAEHAVWQVAEEGPVARLMFLAGRKWLGDPQSYLALYRSNGAAHCEFTTIPIERTALVRGVYEAFRQMVGRPDYNARHWEIHPYWGEVDHEDEDAYERAMSDWPFSGLRISLMRSSLVEAFLREDDKVQRQFELALSFR